MRIKEIYDISAWMTEQQVWGCPLGKGRSNTHSPPHHLLRPSTYSEKRQGQPSAAAQARDHCSVSRHRPGAPQGRPLSHKGPGGGQGTRRQGWAPGLRGASSPDAELLGGSPAERGRSQPVAGRAAGRVDSPRSAREAGRGGKGRRLVAGQGVAR